MGAGFPRPVPPLTERRDTARILAEKGMRPCLSRYEVHLFQDCLDGWHTVCFQPWHISFEPQVLARCRELTALGRMESRSRR